MKNQTFRARVVILIVLFQVWVTCLQGLSSSTPPPPPSQDRRRLLTWPIGIGGAVVYGKLVADAVEKLSRGDLVYPEAHETRVENIISKATTLSAISLQPKDGDTNQLPRPLRILEVGIGKEWRVERRGLYRTAFQQLPLEGVKHVELTGVDIITPSANTMDAAREKLEKILPPNDLLEVSLNTVQGSITSKLDGFADGYFDCVICALTLCSVDNQNAALQEMKRLVRPNGGTFGYVEHVAVNPDEPYQFLELQQRIFDPLQQAVADNCHLHRFTESEIASVFDIGNGSSRNVFSERYLVEGMWPVSCQCCGVVQKV